MLILTRKPGESLYIGDTIKITIVEIKGHQIRVGIDAPTELRIYREEIYVQILEENRKAASMDADAGGLEQLAGSDAPSGVSIGGLGGMKTSKTGGGSGSLGSKLGAGSPKSAEAAKGSSSKGKSKDPEVVVKRKKAKKSDD